MTKTPFSTVLSINKVKVDYPFTITLKQNMVSHFMYTVQPASFSLNRKFYSG